MSNLRDQLLKAGLVSAKQARQAAHEQRVHRKEAGYAGIEQEQKEREEAFRQEQEAKRRQDREESERRRAHEAEEALRQALATRIVNGWVRDATAGDRRFFFVAAGDRITYLDLSDRGMQRLRAGAGAIVETRGFVRGEFCVVDQGAAEALAREHPEVIRYWNRNPAR